MTERKPTGSFIDDLADIPGLNDLDRASTGIVPANPKKSRETFPCESCRGTGRYQGVRVHQPEEKCFACKGKGYFLKSYADRMAGKKKRAQAKMNRWVLAQTEFEKAHPGLIAKVRADLLPWNAFAASLIEQYDDKATLTEKQVAALQTQLDKNAERQAARAATKAAETQKLEANPVDPSAIRELFETAKSNGLKKPGLWFGDLKISEAPSHGRNAGALYVKQGGEYAGKIIGSTFHPAWGVPAMTILNSLLEIASNPAEVLRVKGKETGKCCCCGRELTDPESVANGIGPICATNWGL